MSTLSIRSLPKILERALKEETRRSGKTKTEIVIRALENLFHLGGKATKREKLRAFFGRMSREEFEAFQRATACFSEVDKDLWS